MIRSVTLVKLYKFWKLLKIPYRKKYIYSQEESILWSHISQIIWSLLPIKGLVPFYNELDKLMLKFNRKNKGLVYTLKKCERLDFQNIKLILML